MRVPFVIALMLALPGAARAAVQAGADAAVAASYATETRAYVYAFLGGDSVVAGPFCHASESSGYSKDTLIGGAVRFGRTVHVDVGAGAVRHSYDYEGVKISSKGVGGLLSLGLQIGEYAHLSLPIVFKSFTSPNPPTKAQVEAVPMFGISFGVKP